MSLVKRHCYFRTMLPGLLRKVFGATDIPLCECLPHTPGQLPLKGLLEFPTLDRTSYTLIRVENELRKLEWKCFPVSKMLGV